MQRWPDAAAIDRAARHWAEALGVDREGVLRIAYFGSYARGDWGVGSDLDLVVILKKSEKPLLARGLDFDLGDLPVPAELMVYTQAEWERMGEQGTRLYHTIETEGVWIY